MSDVYGNETLVPEYRRCVACNEPMTMVIHMINSADPEIRRQAHKFRPAVSLQKGETMPKDEEQPMNQLLDALLDELCTCHEVPLSPHALEHQSYCAGFRAWRIVMGQPTASAERTALQNTLTELERGNVFRASQILRAALQSAPSSPPPDLTGIHGSIDDVSHIAPNYGGLSRAPSDAGQSEPRMDPAVSKAITEKLYSKVPALEKLRELEAKWRKELDVFPESETGIRSAGAMRYCADELHDVVDELSAPAPRPAEKD